jgi:hypothetical protein
MDEEQITTNLDTEGVQDTGNEDGGNIDEQIQATEFSLPDEYAQKDWAKNFQGQSGDELKTNLLKALDEKYSSTATVPETVEEYALNDILKDENGNLQFSFPEDALEYFGNEFKDLGLTKEQGQGILKKYTDFEIEKFQEYTNADELEKNVSAMFNGDTQKRQTVESLIKEFLPQQDQQFLQEVIPNNVIEMFYKLATGLVDKYGFKEGTQNSNNNTGMMRMSEQDKDAEYNRLVGEMESLTKRPHKPEEKQAIQRQIMALFQ